jgi:hypothetical protein
MHHEIVDLSKIDVQGGELAVFQGAEETLRRTRMMWTEVSFRTMYEGAALFSDIHSFMYQSGFILLWISLRFRGAGGNCWRAMRFLLSNSGIRFHEGVCPRPPVGEGLPRRWCYTPLRSSHWCWKPGHF